MPSSSGRAPLSASAKEVDGSYFDSYGGFGIHREMISDKVCKCMVSKRAMCIVTGLQRRKPLVSEGNESAHIPTLWCCSLAQMHINALWSATLAW